MRLKASRSSGGRHRTITTSQTKGRLALVAVAAGTVSSAGVGGATAATLQAPAEVEAPVSPEAATVEVDLATNDTALSSSGTQAAPQILAISEFKPVANIDEQLDKAIQYNAERAENERAARSPSVVKPAEGAFTSGSGVRWGTLHAGIDIANVVGTPILAAMGGTVIDSGPASGFGQWIRIQHDDGSIAVYGHMETLDVTVGERVTAGQRIAGMGNRGFSTGSHLHFAALPDWQRGGRPVALVRRARRHLLTFPHSPGPAPTPEPAAVTGHEAPTSDRRDASHSSPTQPRLDSFSRQGRPGHRGSSPCSSYMGAASVPPTRSRCRNPRLVGYFRNLPSPAPADEAGNRRPCKSQHRENQQGRIPHARIRRQTSMKGNGCRQQFVRAQATEL